MHVQENAFNDNYRLYFQAQVSEDLANFEKYSNEQKEVREKYEATSAFHEKSYDINRSLRDKIDCYRDVLSKLITNTEGSSGFPSRDKIDCLKPLSREVEIITPNIKARATVYSQQVKGKGKQCCKKYLS